MKFTNNGLTEAGKDYLKNGPPIEPKPQDNIWVNKVGKPILWVTADYDDSTINEFDL